MKEQVPFSMAIEKEELMHECSPEHLRMGTADRNEIIKDKGEEGKKKGMNVERSTVGTKKSRQPKRQKSLNLVQSRQSLTTVCQEVPVSKSGGEVRRAPVLKLLTACSATLVWSVRTVEQTHSNTYCVQLNLYTREDCKETGSLSLYGKREPIL